MAIITKVQECKYKDGKCATYWRVYYMNKNRYKDDRVRLYTEIPKSAKAFIETATDVSIMHFYDMDVTTYKR